MIQIWLVVLEKKAFKIFYLAIIYDEKFCPLAAMFFKISCNLSNLGRKSPKHYFCKIFLNLASCFGEEDFRSFLYSCMRKYGPAPQVAAIIVFLFVYFFLDLSNLSD